MGWSINNFEYVKKYIWIHEDTPTMILSLKKVTFLYKKMKLSYSLK